MIKTWEEYYNDPEIINEPSAMREIHAIRLMLADERKGMTAEEHTALVKKEGEAFLAECRKHRGLHE
jgi:hypothetical protein